MAIITSDGQVVVDLVLDAKGAVSGARTASGAVLDFEKKVKKPKKSLEELMRAARGVDASLNDVAAAQKRVTRAFKSARTEEDRRRYAALAAELDHTEREMRRLGHTTERAAGIMGRLRAALPIARMVSLAGAVALVGRGIGATVRSAIELEDAMAGVQKTTGLSDDELGGLERTLLRMSARLGISGRELAGFAEVAGQLGIEGRENIASFVETAAKLERVSDLSAEAAGRLLAQISNAFGVPIEQSAQLGSVLNELSNTTAATAGDVADALQRVGAAGRNAGLTADEVAGIVATLIDAGLEARIAGTSIRNVLTIMQTEAGKVAEQMGVTESAFRATFGEDPLRALQEYLGALGDMPPQLQAIRIEDVFGRENLLAVQTLAGQTDRLNEVLGISRTAFVEGTSLSREYSAVLDTFSIQWERFTARVTAASLALGQQLLGSMTRVLRVFNLATAGVDELREEYQRLDEQIAQQRALGRAITRYEELSGKLERTAEEAAELKTITEQLRDTFPGLVRETNAAAGAVRLLTDRMREATDAERRFLQMRQQRILADMVEDYREAQQAVRDLSGELGEAQDRLDQQGGLSQNRIVGSVQLAGLQRLADQMDSNREAAAAFEEQTRALFQSYQDAGDFEGISELNDRLHSLGLSWGEIARIRTDGGRAFADMAQGAAGAAEEAESLGDSVADLAGTTGEAAEEAERFKTAMERAEEEAKELNRTLADLAATMADPAQREHLETVIRENQEVERQIRLYRLLLEARTTPLPEIEGRGTLGDPEGALKRFRAGQLADDALEQLRTRAPEIETEFDRIAKSARASFSELGVSLEGIVNVYGGAVTSILGTFGGAFADFFAASDRESKAALAAYKAVAIAQAIIDTYAAATAAYRAMVGIPVIGPGLAVAAAGAAIAAGLANVERIRSMQPGGGSGGSEGSGRRFAGDPGPSGGKGMRGALAGRRAAGGPVDAGRPYLVGERGPEVVVPDVPGFVVSNAALVRALGFAAGGASPSGGVRGHTQPTAHVPPPVVNLPPPQIIQTPEGLVLAYRQGAARLNQTRGTR